MSKRSIRRKELSEIKERVRIGHFANRAYNELMLEALKFLEDADLEIYHTEHTLEQYNQRWRTYCREHSLLPACLPMFTNEINKIIQQVKAEKAKKENADDNLHPTSENIFKADKPE